MTYIIINNYRISTQVISSAFGLLVYKFSLDIIYYFLLSPVYEYSGFIVNFSIYKYVLSLVLFMSLLYFIIGLYKNSAPSALILLIINLIYFIPGLTLYSFWSLEDDFFFYFALYWSLLMILHGSIPTIKIRQASERSHYIFFYTSLIVITILMLIISGVYNGFKLHFSLMDIYDLRADQKAMHLPVWVQYLQPLSSVIFPVAIVYFLIEKKKMWTLLLILIQLLSFAFGGSKFTLFAIVASILAYFFYKENRKTYLIYGLLLLTVLAFIEFFVSGNKFSFISAYIHKRLFFTTVEISYNYFDFFHGHEFLYWRDSFLRWFGFESPYQGDLSTMIGDLYYNRPEMNCNNGLVGDAVANWGWGGCFIYPILLCIIFKVLDACCKNLDSRIILITCILFAVSFTNVSFFGVLLTGGYIFTCLFLYMLPRKSKTK